jgi:plasmid stabilization system protein ParE
MRIVEFSPVARRDFERLRLWLEERAPHAVEEAAGLLSSAANSLAEFPERGRLAMRGLRELIVPFGSAGYVLRYGVRRNRVIVARVFHSLERR